MYDRHNIRVERGGKTGAGVVVSLGGDSAGVVCRCGAGHRNPSVGGAAAATRLPTHSVFTQSSTASLPSRPPTAATTVVRNGLFFILGYFIVFLLQMKNL